VLLPPNVTLSRLRLTEFPSRLAPVLLPNLGRRTRPPCRRPTPSIPSRTEPEKWSSTSERWGPRMANRRPGLRQKCHTPFGETPRRSAKSQTQSRPRPAGYSCEPADAQPSLPAA